MSPELAELLEVLPACAGSSAGAPLDAQGLSVAEQVLGVTLPPDYKEFMTAYGGGEIGSFVWVARPAGSVDEQPYSPSLVDVTRTFRAGLVRSPEPGSENLSADKVLRWGGDEGGNDYLWLMDGPKPEEWPVLIQLHGGPLVACRFGMVEYLRRACAGLHTGELAALSLGPQPKFVHWRESYRLMAEGIDPWTGEPFDLEEFD